MISYTEEVHTLKKHTLIVKEREAAWAVIKLYKTHYYLEELYTEIDYRNLGLATTLINSIINTYTDLPIFLEAEPYGNSKISVVDLVRFYESKGFIESGVGELGSIEMVKVSYDIKYE